MSFSRNLVTVVSRYWPMAESKNLVTVISLAPPEPCRNLVTVTSLLAWYKNLVTVMSLASRNLVTVVSR